MPENQPLWREKPVADAYPGHPFSEKGLVNHSVLRSLFETAKRQGKKVHLFFHDLFTKNTIQAQAALYRYPLQAKPTPSKTSAANKPP